MGLSVVKRRPRRPPVDRRERDDSGTPEARAKIDGDPLQDLLLRAWAHLPPDHETWNRQAAERAAEEIRAVYTAIVRGLMAGAMKYGELSVGKTEIGDALAHHHSDRYLPWVRSVGPILADAVIQVVVDRNWITPLNYARVGRALLDYAGRMR